MAYTYNRAITIDHTKLGSTDLANYPVLIHLNDATFKTVGNGGHVQNANAYDVGFFSDSGGASPLFWEILSYDGSTGEIWAFAKVASVSHTVDTVIYVFYGDASISTFQSTVTSVWSASYSRVMHLAESAHPYADSGPNGWNSSSTADPAQVTGKFYKAQSFVAASVQKVSGMTQGGASNGSVSGWFKSSTTNNVSVIIDCRFNASQFGSVLYVNNNVPSFYRNNIGPVAGSSGICDGNWHYIVGTYISGTEIRLYVDGASVASNGGGSGVAEQSGTAGVGVTSDGSPVYATAVLQEIRQTTINLTAAWILTDYNNQNSPDTFITVGAESGGGSGSLFRISPLSGLGVGGPFFTNPLE